MRDTIAWSYDLLDDAEQALMQSLSTFPETFTPEAAEWVPGVGDRVSDVASIDRPPGTRRPRFAGGQAPGPVRGDTGGEPRYGMLETIREFERDQLAANGRAAARQRHAEWALALTEQARPLVGAPDGPRWLGVLERDHASLRAALTWFMERGDGPAPARQTGGGATCCWDVG